MPPRTVSPVTAKCGERHHQIDDVTPQNGYFALHHKHILSIRLELTFHRGKTHMASETTGKLAANPTAMN